MIAHVFYIVIVFTAGYVYKAYQSPINNWLRRRFKDGKKD